MAYIICKIGHSKTVYWRETQESPVMGIWVANVKKATEFTKDITAKRYIRKYLAKDAMFEFETPYVKEL